MSTKTTSTTTDRTMDTNIDSNQQAFELACSINMVKLLAVTSTLNAERSFLKIKNDGIILYQEFNEGKKVFHFLASETVNNSVDLIKHKTFELKNQELLSFDLEKITFSILGEDSLFSFQTKIKTTDVLVKENIRTGIEATDFIVPSPSSNVFTKRPTRGKILTIASALMLSNFIHKIKASVEDDLGNSLNFGFSQNEEGKFSFKVDEDLYGEFELEYEDLENKYDVIPECFLETNSEEDIVTLGGFSQFHNKLIRGQLNLTQEVLDKLNENEAIVLNKLKEILPSSNGSEHKVQFGITEKGSFFIDFLESGNRLVITNSGKVFCKQKGLFVQDFKDNVELFIANKNKLVKDTLLLSAITGTISLESFFKIVNFADTKTKELGVAFFNLFEKVNSVPTLQIKNGETWIDIDTVALKMQNEDSIVLNVKMTTSEHNQLTRIEKRTVRYNGEEKRLLVSVSTGYNGESEITLHL